MRNQRPGRSFSGRGYAVLRGGVFLALALLLLPGQARELSEAQVKAAFLFNFAAFVNWPDNAFDDPASPLRYCIMAPDSVGSTLDRLIVGERLDGRAMELRRLQPAEDSTGCHILYLHGPRAQPPGPGTLQHQGLLTVGDDEAFLARGGMIALLRKRDRIHPVINLDAVDASSLRLSSKLLRLATRVRSGGGVVE